MNMKTENELAAEIEEARLALEKLQTALADRQAMSPEKRLAIDLHELMCSGRLVGRCDWGNGGTWDTNYEMKEYFTKAEKLLAITTAAEALAIVEVVKGR